MTADDEDLLGRVLAGDEDAFRQVYRDVQPGLVRYLTVLVGTADAEDAAAEAWAQAIRDLGRFSGTLDGFRGWLTTIARNRALDQLRSRSRRPVADLDPADLLVPPTASSAETEALVLDSTSDALALIATLPPDQAEAVLLRAVVGLDAKTAGAVLGKRPGAVRTAAYRGLRRLAETLSENDSDKSLPTDAEGER